MRGRGNRYSRGNRNGRGGHGRSSVRGGGSRGGPGGRFGGNQDGNRFNSQWHSRNRPKHFSNELPGERLSEDQIGVTMYMSEHEGFNGIIKSRYSDFQVSEINLQGEVAQLTTLSPPEQPEEDQVEEDEELLLTKYNVNILPMDRWDEINKVALGTVAGPVEIEVTKATKEERTKIHEAVKKAFGESIVGSTVTLDDKKFVRFEKYKKGVRIDNRVKWTWPGEFVHFLVHKENCDTMDAAVKIADRLRSHIKPSMIGYAGTKDRRAKTTQWFSLRKIDPRKIAAACRDLRDLAVGNYSFHDHLLKLGMLKGNKFRIALRNVTAEDGAVEAACARLRARGFLNYYGLQRFGARLDVPTHVVGRELLKGNLQQAIDSILSEREGPLRAALALHRARGPAAAAAALPRFAHSYIEAKLLQALAENPNDLYNAMQRIPRNTRLLYLHSYQSLIWNRCVSERIRRFGLEPAAGDLVSLQPEAITEETEDEESDSEESQENSENQTTPPSNQTTPPSNQTTPPSNQTTPPSNQTTPPSNQTTAPSNQTTPPSNQTTVPSSQTTDIKTTENLDNKTQKKKQDKVKVPVKLLTQEDVDSKSYTIYDIIMPLPGYFIEYPTNMKDYYELLLTNDGLTLEMKHKNKSYCLSGAYRLVCARARGVSWSAARYSDPRADLLLSDADLLAGKRLHGIVDDGIFKALLLTMTLPPSCYATMALRELLRTDTSSQNQALLNNYHKRKASSDVGEEGDEKRAKETE